MLAPTTTSPDADIKPNRTVLFAGGGTGGHLFPALAVAERLHELCAAPPTPTPTPPGAQNSRPPVSCRFLCSTRAIDAEILGAERLLGEPVAFRAIPAYPPAARPRALLRFVTNWGSAVRQVRDEIRSARAHGPVTLVAMGGFVAAPAVQAARAERCPVLMVNLDATPGRANRWIAKHAGRILTTAPIAGEAPRSRAPWESITPIVRRAALAPGNAAACRTLLGLDPTRPTLFVTGASQGAASINHFMIAFARAHAAELAAGRWQVVHQTGKSDTDATAAAYADVGIPAVVRPFFREMGVAWGAADVAVSRAGAGSVAEAWANRVPTVFLPYPYHADQHQRRNAEPLVRAGAAVLATDAIEATINLERVGPVLLGLITRDSEATALRAALAALPAVAGADEVARAVLSTP